MPTWNLLLYDVLCYCLGFFYIDVPDDMSEIVLLFVCYIFVLLFRFLFHDVIADMPENVVPLFL